MLSQWEGYIAEIYRRSWSSIVMFFFFIYKQFCLFPTQQPRYRLSWLRSDQPAIPDSIFTLFSNSFLYWLQALVSDFRILLLALTLSCGVFLFLILFFSEGLFYCCLKLSKEISAECEDVSARLKGKKINETSVKRHTRSLTRWSQNIYYFSLGIYYAISKAIFRTTCTIFSTALKLCRE